MNTLRKKSVAGMPAPYFLTMVLLLLLSLASHSLHTDIVGTIAFLVVFGELSAWLGEQIPFVGKWMGGRIVVPMLAGCLFAHSKLVSPQIYEQINGFIHSGFLNLILCSVIAGSILGTDTTILRRSVFPLTAAIIGTEMMILVFSLVGGLLVSGNPIEEAVLTGLPNFCGGSTAALVAVPEILSETRGGIASDYSGRLMLLLNLCSILNTAAAGILSNLSEIMPSFSCMDGKGILIKGVADIRKEKRVVSGNLTTGCVVSVMLLNAGKTISSFFPFFNQVVWMIFLAILLKISGILSEEICASSEYWQAALLQVFLPAVLFGVGMVTIDLSMVREVFTLSSLFMIFMCVLGSLTGSFLFARIFHFYPIDAMIAIGCNTGTIGGSGAITVLSAADRMELMPFAVLAGRLGGAGMLIIYSFLVRFI